MKEEVVEFKPHSEKQNRALWTKRRITCCGTGIQWGKTLVGAARLLKLVHEHTAKNDNFIITSPDYKTMKQSSLPPFLRLIEGLAHYNKKDECFEVYGGGTIWLRTMTDPDSIVGITNVRGIWSDEAGLYSLYAWENIQGRASFGECPIILTTSPYALNWIYKEIILPKMKDPEARPDVELIQARSDENPYFPKAEYERMRGIMETRRFNMMYGGGWDRAEGLVYDCFEVDLNTCEPFTLPPGTVFYGGIDWGHTHPFVLKVRAVTPSGDQFAVSEFYKTGLTITGMIEAAKAKMSTWGMRHVFCGPDRPENIAEMCRAGIPAVAACNDVVRGIDHHYELIKSRKFKIFRGTSPYTMDELEKYHWPSEEELEPNRDSKERNPVKQDDDCLDCDRYITISTYHLEAGRRAPRNPALEKKSETQDKRLLRLQRGTRSEHSEKWS